VVGLARSLSALQRQHHHTENDQLFPEVSARLDEAALAELRRELERFDQQPTHRARRAAARDVGDALIARYSPLAATGE